MLESSFWVAMHGGIRWLIVLAAVIALVLVLIGFFTNGTYSRTHRGVFGILNGLLGIQFLLGLILIVWRGMQNAGLPAEAFDAGFWWGTRIAHLIFNLLGIVAVAIGSSRARKATQAPFRPALIGLLAGFVLIYLGVSSIGAWPWQ